MIPYSKVKRYDANGIINRMPNFYAVHRENKIPSDQKYDLIVKESKRILAMDEKSLAKQLIIEPLHLNASLSINLLLETARLIQGFCSYLAMSCHRVTIECFGASTVLERLKQVVSLNPKIMDRFVKAPLCKDLTMDTYTKLADKAAAYLQSDLIMIENGRVGIKSRG